VENLPQIADKIRLSLDNRTRARDRALERARELTRCAAYAIRAVHRNEYVLAQENLLRGHELVSALKNDLLQYPDLYFAGYTQDAIKEFAEANITYALVRGVDLPDPEVLGVEYTAYLNGLAEAAGELRRRCLDILRHGYSDEAERLLFCMDEIYALLVTLDYPDAITNGLRRQTDVLRSILERTRGDLTISLREHYLQQSMVKLLKRIDPDAELPELDSTELSSNADDSSV